VTVEILVILAVAVVLDLALGDPPDAIHPVAWMGKFISLLEKRGLKLSPKAQFLYGIMITLFTAGLFIVPVYFILFYIDQLSVIASTIVASILLKSTFSIRGLMRAALKIKSLLQENKLSQTKLELRSLVSRDTKNLNEPLTVSAAVESVAEGLGDSLVAPVFYFLLFGIPGAIGYRVVNTIDSMIGYHGKYEYLGKFAARLDDVLNFIPARLASLLLVLAACLTKRNGGNTWRTALREHAKTESPNAGWPMAAMAGALNVQLEKPGQYRLGNANAALVPDTIGSAVKMFAVAASAWILICLVAEGIYHVVTA